VALTSTVDSLGLTVAPWQAVTDIGAGHRFLASDYPSGSIHTVFGVSGCLPMYRRGAVGTQLFDPSYVFYKEDVDLAYRLRRAGHLAATVADARAWHLRSLKPGLAGRGRDAAGYRRLFYSYRNHLRNLHRNLTWRDWLVYGWCILPYELAKAAFLLLTQPSIIWRVITRRPA
jgi:GT2 family glycosyltransferase